MVITTAAACADLPTGTDVIHHQAVARHWLAVSIPHAIPELDRMLGEMPADVEEARRARILLSGAYDARIEGDHELARRRTDRAAALAARAMVDDFDSRRIILGIDAIERWVENLEHEPRLRLAPSLQAALGEVSAELGALKAAYASGDETAALTHLFTASERIREHSPASTAVRALAEVEARLEAVDPDDEQRLRRSRLLVWSAREALNEGDSRTALRSALYALQLAAGQEVLEDQSTPLSNRCVMEDCR